MFKKHLTNERGMSLMMVFLLMIVLTVLGMGIMSVVISNTRATSSERDNQAAYYIAEAGITKQMKAAEDAARKLYPLQSTAPGYYTNLESQILKTTTLTDFASSFGVKPSAKVTIAKVSGENPRQYKITSVGTIGKRSKQLEKTFTISWEMKGGLALNKDLAVYTSKLFTMDNGTINGNIGSNSKETPSIVFPSGNPKVYGDIFVPAGLENKAVQKKNSITMPNPKTLKEEAVFQLPPFPSIPSYPTYPNLTIKKGSETYDLVSNGVLKTDREISNYYTLNIPANAYFKRIQLTANRTIYFDVGDTDKSIVVDNLELPTGHIVIKGTGRLTIYVKNAIEMGGGSTINNNGVITRLNIFLAQSTPATTVQLGGNQKIFGSLYAENADIEMNGGGGFQGHIFTGGKNVSIYGGARVTTSLFYAPNASFNLLGGGAIKGMIVSETFSASGGAKVDYQPVDLEEVPYSTGGSTGIPEGLITSAPVREK